MTSITTEELRDLIQRAARGRSRYLVAIAGAPGSGKSTLAAELAGAIPGAQAIPMDGFHLDNDVLYERGLFERKGAPETFDAAGFVAFIAALAAGTQDHFPTFDRAADAVVPMGGRIAPDTKVFVVEGNYLLLDEAPWRDIAHLWDVRVVLDVAEHELERRLVQRWIDHGHAPEDALQRAHANDLVNARAVRDRSVRDAFVLAQSVT